MMAPRMKIAWGEAKRGRDHGGGVTRVSCKFVLGSMAPRALRSDMQCLRSQPAGPSHQGPTASPRPAVQAPIPVWAGGPAHPCLRVMRGCHLLSHGRRQRPGALSPSHSPVAAGADPLSLPPPQPEPRINAATQQSGCQPPSLPPRPSRERLEKGVKGS